MFKEITLIGNLGKKPEMLQLEGGNNVTKFSLATTNTYKGKKDTTWHNIEAWGKTAELVEKYLDKGSKVMVRGRMCFDEYMKDGEKKTWARVFARDVLFLDVKKTETATPENVDF